MFVMLLLVVYGRELGAANFLWGSDIALLVTLLALWLENRFLASMMAVGVLLPELFWNIDFFSHLVAGHDVLGLDATAYMFASDKPLLLRGLSLFHVFLPLVLLYLLMRLGYDRRAFAAQILLCWIILPLSYFFTDPARNINWVFGIMEVPQTWMPGILYLFLLMLLFPLLVYWPTHLLLKHFFEKD